MGVCRVDMVVWKHDIGVWRADMGVWSRAQRNIKCPRNIQSLGTASKHDIPRAKYDVPLPSNKMNSTGQHMMS